MIYTISNDILTVEVSTLGGELVSVSDKRRSQPLRTARRSASDTPYGGWLSRWENATICA